MSAGWWSDHGRPCASGSWPSIQARAEALALARPEVERLFATLGEPADGGRAFIQPMRLNLLRRV